MLFRSYRHDIQHQAQERCNKACKCKYSGDHSGELQEALRSLHLVLQSIADDMPEDFYSIDLMNAYEELGNIIGESVEDDLVNEIFSKFCMGK